MHAALDLVRLEFGPDASILRTREIRPRRIFGLIRRPHEIEITASSSANTASRSPRDAYAQASRASHDTNTRRLPREKITFFGTSNPHTSIDTQANDVPLPVVADEPLSDSLFRVFADLIEADLSERTARELINEARQGESENDLADPVLLRRRIEQLVESRLPVGGPLQVTPGKRLVAALVGPTGVGKTTTIAKLAAHYRLREKRTVGLITVDTYRIAAIEQLRTYAQIIDLPMEVVSTPREMRDASASLAGVDLLLIDTAGRSPHDELKIQELRALLEAAEVDETHLVLSAATGARTLQTMTERFASVGTNSLILTKLDEASGLGPLYPIIRDAGLPVRYCTTGQNVPDDIEVAEPERLARQLLEPGR